MKKMSVAFDISMHISPKQLTRYIKEMATMAASQKKHKVVEIKYNNGKLKKIDYPSPNEIKKINANLDKFLSRLIGVKEK